MKHIWVGGNEIHFSGIKFVFLDRDGVINRNPPYGRYVTSWRDFEMLPDAERAVSYLNKTGRKVIVITNQRGIALGRMTVRELEDIHASLQTHLNSCGAHLDAIYFCPHDQDECDCRKPGTGLFVRAFREYPGASPQNSVMIGDSDSDVLAGVTLGMRTVLITDEPNTTTGSVGRATASARSLIEAVELYLSK